MIRIIAEMAATDDHALSLLDKARECAGIYLLVTKRQKGCDGMGEVAMIREEFREAVDDLIKCCKGRESGPKDFDYDLDSIAIELSDVRVS